VTAISPVVTEHPSEDGEDQWAASLLFDRDPARGVDEEVADAQPEVVDAEEADTAAEPLDLDTPSSCDRDGSGTDTNAGAKKAAVVLAAALLAAAVLIVGSLTVVRPPNPPASANPLRPSITGRASATPVVSPADVDQAVPFTASANCPAGSTSAQALTDTSRDSAWVCVRGAPGGQVDGQVLRIDLGRSYLLTAVSVTPGWVAKTPGDKDEWLAHRVVTRLQYDFNDDERTILTQDTANTHGPVTTPLAHRVLASRVTVIILQTSRPPASPPQRVDPTSATAPGFIDSVLANADGPLPADTSQTTASAPEPGQDSSDPVDATFAVAAMKFLGHQPQ
jgi:hypothetical protein